MATRGIFGQDASNMFNYSDSKQSFLQTLSEKTPLLLRFYHLFHSAFEQTFVSYLIAATIFRRHWQLLYGYSIMHRSKGHDLIDKRSLWGHLSDIF